MSMNQSGLRKLSRVSGAVAITAALALTGCSPSSPGAAASVQKVSQDEVTKALATPTKLTFWSWLPSAQVLVDAFEAKYPAIDVELVQTTGAEQEQRLRTAIQAGSGVPDAVHLSSPSVSSFVLSEDLLDLRPYGADDLEEEFLPAVWATGAIGDGVYGVPQDTGPVASLYRTDILEQAGITKFPETWKDFAETAKTVKDKTGSYITNLSSLEIQALSYQASEQPLHGWDGGENVELATDNADVMKWAAYWQDLIDRNLVSTDAPFTDPWYQGMASGKYASWITAPWGPIFLQGTAANTAGKWRVAEVPQWDPSKPVFPNLGGSSTSVLKSTKNPIAAATFAQWMNADPESTELLSSKAGLFPATKAMLKDPEWRNRPDAFFGGQPVNALFADTADKMDVIVYPPFYAYMNTAMNDTVAAALANKTSMADGLHAYQDKLVQYAKDQGFKVKQD
jgi:multiple sugar transport system substrate-binding protein